jgi:NAD(P)H-hydrate repair Nnr-like enzyme with NAD(P)H-hydrate dehydratase domain
LGKKISELPPELTENKVKEGHIWVVGGNYFGEWNLDVKDFQGNKYINYKSKRV